MDVVKALAERWKEEADALESRYLDERAARFFRLHAVELEEAIREAEDEALTLSEAADASGYTADHLRHLVADGTIPNAGRKGAPRIRRADLPMKPGADPDAAEDAATAEARNVLRAVRGSA